MEVLDCFRPSHQLLNPPDPLLTLFVFRLGKGSNFLHESPQVRISGQIGHRLNGFVASTLSFLSSNTGFEPVGVIDGSFERLCCRKVLTFELLPFLDVLVIGEQITEPEAREVLEMFCGDGVAALATADHAGEGELVLLFPRTPRPAEVIFGYRRTDEDPTDDHKVRDRAQETRHAQEGRGRSRGPVATRPRAVLGEQPAVDSVLWLTSGGLTLTSITMGPSTGTSVRTSSRL